MATNLQISGPEGGADGEEDAEMDEDGEPKPREGRRAVTDHSGPLLLCYLWRLDGLQRCTEIGLPTKRDNCDDIVQHKREAFIPFTWD
jgi:hypothetical protein